MRNNTSRKCLTAACLLVANISVSPAFATWYVHQSQGDYKQEDYRNKKYGDFVPADINEKIFVHRNTRDQQKTSKTQDTNTSIFFNNSQTVPRSIQQAPKPAFNYPGQNARQPAYNRYNRGRNYAPPGNQRYERNKNYNRRQNNNR